MVVENQLVEEMITVAADKAMLEAKLAMAVVSTWYDRECFVTRGKWADYSRRSVMKLWKRTAFAGSKST
jgi:hypothetical protein